MSQEFLDPREYPYRPDLAASYLKSSVRAEKYVDGELYHVVSSILPIRKMPNQRAERVSELLFGECFIVYEYSASWAWGQSQTDGYVGFVNSEGLSSKSSVASHEVIALKTIVFEEPDIRAPIVQLLYMTAKIEIKKETKTFYQMDMGGWVPTKHLGRIGSKKENLISAAVKYIGAPYLWGGRSSAGLDCSALVQLSMERSGILDPRDTDQQEHCVGKTVFGGINEAQSGDLLYMKGHVAILLKRNTVLHANAYHMSVAEEPISVFMKRLVDNGMEISSVRRPKQAIGDASNRTAVKP